MIPRSAWNARPPTSPNPGWQPGEPIGVAVHYVGGSGPIGLADHAQCMTLMHNLQATAMDPNRNYQWHYNDIEYNVAACPHGQVIEARGVNVQDAAQLGGNNTYASVLALANVGDPIEGTALGQAVTDAIGIIRQVYPSAVDVRGHRDVAGNPTGTDCPGDLIEAWLHGSHPTPPPLSEDDQMGIAHVYEPTLAQHHTFGVPVGGPRAGHVIHAWSGTDGVAHSEDLSAKLSLHEGADSSAGCAAYIDQQGTLVVVAVTADGASLCFRSGKGSAQWGAQVVGR